MKKVIAVVVTYNRKELLKECIEALLNQEYKDLQILIIDNASTDGTEEYIDEFIIENKIIYKNTGSNLGGAGGFNFGMKEACHMDCDFVWLMDDDCIVNSDTLTKLIEADEKLDGKYGFLSSKALWNDGSICRMNVQQISINKKVKDWNIQMQKIISATFVSFFISRKRIDEFGLPIKEFFIWADDIEYSRRISKKYDCYLIADSVVTHKTKNNIGSNLSQDEEKNFWRYEYAYRNECYIYGRENIIWKLYYFLRIMLHKYRIIKNSNLSKEDKNKRIKLINDSLKRGKDFNPSIEFVPKKTPIRVLEVISEPLSNGGQESFLMNMYRNIDKSKIIFDFFTPYYCDNMNIKEELEKTGSKVYVYNGRFDDSGNKEDLRKNVKSFFKDHYYDIVHIHSGSTYALMYISKIARKSGAKNVIVHSHCGGFKNLKYRVIKFTSALTLLKYPTNYCACSDLAAEWKFPKKIIKNQEYTILKNAIDINKFYYSDEIRKQKRIELGIDDKFVVGHIGRFSIQKNHSFLVDVFNEILKKKENAVLLLIGNGELQDTIKNKVKELGIEKNVIFLGLRKDINELLNAMDMFLLPSFFEGLPVVGVEAEATGLPIYMSDKVTKELPINDLAKYYSLSDAPEKWADSILLNQKNIIRRNTTDEIIQAGYDVNTAAKIMQDYYMGMSK